MIGTPKKPSWPYTLNRGCDQARGLVGWWPGAPSGGIRIYDQSGCTRHATISGTIPAGGPWRAGVDGDKSAVLFDQSTNYALSGTRPFITNCNQQFTYMAWVYPTNLGALADRAIIGFGETNDSNYAANFILYDSTGEVAMRNGDTIVIHSGLFVTLNQWNLVGVSSRNATATFICNGRIATVTGFNNAGYNIGVGNAFVMGVRFVNSAAVAGTYFGGRIEGWAAYTRALSSAEMLSLYSPATRWQLRYAPGRKTWSCGSAATGNRRRRVIIGAG